MAMLSTARVKELTEEINVFIDELNHFYQLYFSGVERTPPSKRRQTLERMVKELSRSNYPPFIQFKVKTTISRYNTYKTLWDKKMERFLEYGTINKARIKAIKKNLEEGKPVPKRGESIFDMDEDTEREISIDPKNIDQTVEELSLDIMTDLSIGKSKISDLSVIEKTVKNKIDNVMKKIGKNKKFKLGYEIKDGKIKFKAKIKKDDKNK